MTDAIVEQGARSEEETKIRINLAALYRLTALNKWDDLIFTHISARIPGPDNHFLINPYGMLFEEITASDLVKIDQDANPVDPTPYPVNPAGFTIHSAIHQAREDAHFVIHLHTDASCAVSAQADGLLPLTQTAMIAIADLSYHGYEGIALNHDEKERLVADLGQTNSMLLRNHGSLSCGETAAAAWLRIYFLERACRMQVMAQSGGGALISGDQQMQDLVGQQSSPQGMGSMAEFLLWPAMLRKLERACPDYKN